MRLRRAKQDFLHFKFELRGAGMVQWLASHQCGPGSIPGLGVICGLSVLLVLYSDPRGFSPGTPVFTSPQNQHFQIAIRSGIHGHFWTSSCELLGAPWVNKLRFLFTKSNFYPTNLLSNVQRHKWSPTKNDPQTGNGSQMIPNRKWSLM